MKRRPRSIKVTLFGHVFDSKGEGERAKYLVSLASHGVIEDLVFDKTKLKFIIQPRTTIHPEPRLKIKRKRTIPAITYEIDFAYTFNGLRILEDYKGAGKSGRPRIERDSSIRFKMLANIHATDPFTIVRICTIPTADPDDERGYWYSLHERPKDK